VEFLTPSPRHIQNATGLFPYIKMYWQGLSWKGKFDGFVRGKDRNDIESAVTHKLLEGYTLFGNTFHVQLKNMKPWWKC